MQCVNPVGIAMTDRKRFPEGSLKVPCGKCVSCRIQKRKEWSMRLKHELNYFDNAMFLTLTYSDEHLPEYDSLKKEHLQLFFKRLRKKYSNAQKFGHKIKYFACGEYGELTERPHYHMILFGLGLNRTDKENVMDSWDYCDWNNLTIRKKSFGLVEDQSIDYVSGYINKKLSGELADEHYTQLKREPVFKLSSNGLGERYCKDNEKDLNEKQMIYLKGKEHSLPRYYIKKLGLTTEQMSLKAQERDCETVEYYTGIWISETDLYKVKNQELSKAVALGQKTSREQRERNLKSQLKLKGAKL